MWRYQILPLLLGVLAVPAVHGAESHADKKSSQQSVSTSAQTSSDGSATTSTDHGKHPGGKTGLTPIDPQSLLGKNGAAPVDAQSLLANPKSDGTPFNGFLKLLADHAGVTITNPEAFTPKSGNFSFSSNDPDAKVVLDKFLKDQGYTLVDAGNGKQTLKKTSAQ